MAEPLGVPIPVGDINIPVTLTPVGFKETKEQAQQVSKEIKELERTTRESTKTTVQQTTATTSMGSQNRMLAWDFMLLGRSLGIVNRELGLNNRALSAIAGVMQLISSVMRIMIIAEELYNLSLAKTNISLATKAALGPLSMMSSGIGNNQAGGLSIAGGIGFKAVEALLMGGFATGGSVLQTGPYLLHKGETVQRPQDRTNYSNVNINMRTGAISNSIDVERMIEDMTTSLALENRRRA
jgi:hypothetical protein